MTEPIRGSVSSATAVGLRAAQEDRFVVVELDGGFALAVFDGHNGAGTAEMAASLLPETFRRSLERSGSGRATVVATIGTLHERTADREDGSSVSLVHVDETAGRATAGVLGDSPVIIREADGEATLGPLHNTMANPADAERAVARGALFVWPYLVDDRTLEGVNLTRTIGDAALRFLGRTPETFSVALGAQSYVLVGTDGLFTPVASTPEALVERVDRLVTQGAEAQDLVDDALAEGSDDNVTVVLWKAGSSGSRGS